jgi:hypothetical protein
MKYAETELAAMHTARRLSISASGLNFDSDSGNA